MARWDIGTQSWDLTNVFDNKSCDQCGYEQKWLDEEEIIKPNSIWVYKDKQYQVNSVLARNLIQDPQLNQWRPTVRYTTFPQNGLVFYRADTEFFRKFSPLED